MRAGAGAPSPFDRRTQGAAHGAIHAQVARLGYISYPRDVITDISTNLAAFGWEVHVEADRALIADVRGVPQALLALPGSSVTGRAPLRLPLGATASLTVGGEETLLQNGTPGATRRDEQTAHATVAGRRYEVVHTSPRRARVLRDGQLLAELTTVSREDGAAVAVVAHEPFDRTDQVLVVVAQEFIRPGRPAVAAARSERMRVLAG